jgi:hypothetical protein
MVRIGNSPKLATASARNLTPPRLGAKVPPVPETSAESRRSSAVCSVPLNSDVRRPMGDRSGAAVAATTTRALGFCPIPRTSFWATIRIAAPCPIRIRIAGPLRPGYAYPPRRAPDDRSLTLVHRPPRVVQSVTTPAQSKEQSSATDGVQRTDPGRVRRGRGLTACFLLQQVELQAVSPHGKNKP